LNIYVFKKIFGINFLVNKLSRCNKNKIKCVLECGGAVIGKNVNFKNDIKIDNASGDEDATDDFSNIVIGNNCYIGRGVFFDLPDKILIGDDCAVSAEVMLLTHQDCGRRIMSKWYPRKRSAITIGKGTWIGARTIILPGVNLGQCCVVGAGSIVRDSFPDFSVLAGVPARLVKILEQ
jgi:maltose O-acetyltransferase